MRKLIFQSNFDLNTMSRIKSEITLVLWYLTMDLEEIGINAGNWVDSAQDRNYWRALVNAALNLRVP